MTLRWKNYVLLNRCTRVAMLCVRVPLNLFVIGASVKSQRLFIVLFFYVSVRRAVKPKHNLCKTISFFNKM
uniref:Uncharacterized protein n=1 Tax=Trichogramma kaykai TaxID=54128 RepID=A0ABD2X0Y3_9HYME